MSSRGGLYQDPRFKLPLRSLMPGEMAACRGEHGYVTLLGSCVAACIYDSQSGVGGMNHFLLPESGDIDPTHAGWAQAARYGNHAMELLINQTLELGGQRPQLCAKVFGGAAVLSRISSLVGERNVNFVETYLRLEGIPIVAQQVGGSLARQVFFFPRSGEAFVRQVQATETAALVQREQAFEQKIQAEKPQSSIYLF